MKIAFYSHCNNGDVFISREMLRWTMEHVRREEYLYYHRHSDRLLLDFPGVKQLPLEEAPWLDQRATTCLGGSDGTFYLNTWYAVSPVWNKGNGFGCTLNTLHELLKLQMKQCFGVTVKEPVEWFVPKIDFTPFMRPGQTPIGELFRRASKQKTVLLCNGQPMSGQTRMMPGVFEKALNEVMDLRPDVLFLLTNDDGGFGERPNLDRTARLLGTPPGQNDLCETAWLSKFCDVIVGRASGPYSFAAYLHDNFFDPEKTMVCFTDDEKTARWVYPVTGPRARVLWSNDYRPEAVRDLILQGIGQ